MTTPLASDDRTSTAPITRRAWLGALTALLAPALLPARLRAATPAPTPLTVFKDPTCGCCQQWVVHMAAAGFRPAVQDVEDIAAIKQRYGVPNDVRSCHTALVGSYVVEGHVPAADVRRMLCEAPVVNGRPARGLAVPGMPAGSPGMEGDRRERYDVLAFATDGTTQRFASH